jgi:multiple sugar transport system substrate-binding protein
MTDGTKDTCNQLGTLPWQEQSGLTRRRLMQHAGALGVTGTVLGGLTNANWASPASAATYDPKKHAGTKISVLMVGGEGEDRAIADLIPQLEAETGIKLEIEAPQLGPLIEKSFQILKSDRSPFELISYLGFLSTQQVGAGFYQQLNAYIDNPEETPADWDFKDFIPVAVKNVGTYDLKTHTKTGSAIYGVPGFESTSCIYFYRKDLFDAAGLKPAKTWDEFKSNAQKLHKGDVAGCSFIGANDASLGLVDWFTRFITIGGRLMSGDPNGKDFRPHIDSPEGIAALQMLIDALPYAPKNVTQYGFAENVDGFSVGKIAQMVFWATIAGPVFDKEKSLVADKTGTAPVPAGPGQKPRSILGGWGIGIPKNADETKKAAAWRALTWLTSKKTNRYEIEKYQVSPSRMSTFMEPDLVKRFPFLPDSANAIANAEIMPTAYIPEVFQLNAVLCVELNKALIGAQDAKAACAAAQQQWEVILRKGGHLT